MATECLGKRATLFAVVGVALALAQPAPASAQCAFNTPAKAKGYRLSMVRAYVACPPPTPPGIPPNATTEQGVESCIPPMPLSPFTFDDTGRCNIRMQHLVESQCLRPGASGACADVRLKARCGGIRAPSLVPINGLGWKLALRYRITIDEDVGGPMTVLDSSIQLPFPAASGGKLSMSTLVNQACADLGLCLPELPPCTTMELQSVRLLDPNGDIFATAGSASR